MASELADSHGERARSGMFGCAECCAAETYEDEGVGRGVHLEDETQHLFRLGLFMQMGTFGNSDCWRDVASSIAL